jgi:hypothetical protein
MTSAELSKIVWAQSFVGVHIEDPPEAESEEYRKQLLAAWDTLNLGVDKLREENTKLINAMAFVNTTIQETQQ